MTCAEITDGPVALSDAEFRSGGGRYCAPEGIWGEETVPDVGATVLRPDALHRGGGNEKIKDQPRRDRRKTEGIIRALDAVTETRRRRKKLKTRPNGGRGKGCRANKAVEKTCAT